MSDSATPEKKGWFSRLKQGLSRSTSSLTEGITSIFTKRKLDDETLDELEELLIRSDLGVTAAAEVREAVGRGRYNKEVTPKEIKEILSEAVAAILAPVARPLAIDRANRPHVVLVVGVNGTGKTTTIGKLTREWRGQGLGVMLAACDTFRAAAIEQLTIWGERLGAPVVSAAAGADAAGLAYTALEKARTAGSDVLLIDTAGRLQNKSHLMAELEKIIRVIRKLDPTAPHSVLLTLDATTGQNAINQVEVFQSVANVSGLVMTKLDGTARGGVLVAVARRFGLPVHFIGVGEGAEDLQPFDAKGFATALAGKE
ncbi:signal recognition particle-docking protein FtsY [Zavarzinia sp. CC-PAN008]|uniref:signal recognition particle-docking protein FtsY n=1 Tax=Zavarzinia sp. CC-PAN008 TaxID=3243332 RepID=UPI003F742320